MRVFVAGATGCAPGYLSWRDGFPVWVDGLKTARLKTARLKTAQAAHDRAA
jgi:hypothetical protein